MEIMVEVAMIYGPFDVVFNIKSSQVLNEFVGRLERDIDKMFKQVITQEMMGGEIEDGLFDMHSHFYSIIRNRGVLLAINEIEEKYPHVNLDDVYKYAMENIETITYPYIEKLHKMLNYS